MASEQIQVTLVYSPAAREVHEVTLRLAAASTVLQAVCASGLLQLFAAIEPQVAVVGIWGRKVAWNQTLRDQDRVELYRALTVDPKAARRARFAKQGARTAGLFRKKPSPTKPAT